MSREIPQVVRAAAGLAATLLDETRKLPQTLPGLPVRVIGMTMQTAMWLQQQYTGLVARGDELFTGIRGEEEPGLATFDEDLPADEAPASAGFRESAFDRVEDEVTEEDLLSGLADDDAADTAVLSTEDIAESADGAEGVLEELAIEQLVDDELAGLPPEPAPAEVVAAVEEITAQVDAADLAPPAEEDAAATADAAAVENALLEADAAGTAAEPGAADTVDTLVDVPTPEGGVATVEATVTDEGVAAPEPAVEATDEGGTPVAAATGVRTDVAEDTGPADDEGTTGAQAAGTAPIEGYDGWSIAQLRGRLRGYALSTVQDLVTYEEATRAREPYLRMLRNRLEKLVEQAVESSPLAPRGA